MTILVWTVKCDQCGKKMNAIEESYNVREDQDYCDNCYSEM